MRNHAKNLQTAYETDKKKLKKKVLHNEILIMSTPNAMKISSRTALSLPFSTTNLAEAVTEVPNSNLGWDTDYTEDIVIFLYLQAPLP